MSPIVAGQRLVKHVPAAKNIYIGCTFFCEVRVLSKKSRQLILSRISCLRYLLHMFLSNVLLLSNFPVKFLHIILIFCIRGVCSIHPFDFVTLTIPISRRKQNYVAPDYAILRLVGQLKTSGKRGALPYSNYGRWNVEQGP
jgi:hypothetical protein